MGWSTSSSCSELCPSSLHCTADLCALQQTLHISPAGQPCPHAWARASTDVSDTTCPSYLPAMGPDVARRPGTAQPRRPDPRQPDAAQPTTNAFHTTFSRGNSAGKASETLGRGFASFQISTRPRAWAGPAGPYGTLEVVVGHFFAEGNRIVKYCVVVLNYLFGVSKNSQLPCLASFLV